MRFRKSNKRYTSRRHGGSRKHTGSYKHKKSRRLKNYPMVSRGGIRM